MPIPKSERVFLEDIRFDGDLVEDVLKLVEYKESEGMVVNPENPDIIRMSSPVAYIHGTGGEAEARNQIERFRACGVNVRLISAEVETVNVTYRATGGAAVTEEAINEAITDFINTDTGVGKGIIWGAAWRSGIDQIPTAGSVVERIVETFGERGLTGFEIVTPDLNRRDTDGVKFLVGTVGPASG